MVLLQGDIYIVRTTGDTPVRVAVVARINFEMYAYGMNNHQSYNSHD